MKIRMVFISLCILSVCVEFFEMLSIKLKNRMVCISLCILPVCVEVFEMLSIKLKKRGEKPS